MKNWNTDVTRFKTAKDRKIWVGKTIFTSDQARLLEYAAAAEVIARRDS